MKITKVKIPGVLLIEPFIYEDKRGFFLETFQNSRYLEAGLNDKFLQDNHSRSMKNVLRGLHFQINKPQSQLLTILHGRIYDVVVDLRVDSPTFGEWFGVELCDKGLRQIYMPPGMAHGYYVLSDFVDLHYKVSREYSSDDEGGLLWSDPSVGINWPCFNPLISVRDASYPRLNEIKSYPSVDAI